MAASRAPLPSFSCFSSDIWEEEETAMAAQSLAPPKMAKVLLVVVVMCLKAARGQTTTAAGTSGETITRLRWKEKDKNDFVHIYDIVDADT